MKHLVTTLETASVEPELVKKYLSLYCKIVFNYQCGIKDVELNVFKITVKLRRTNLKTPSNHS